MSNKYTFAILGGDRRQAVIAKNIRALGHSTRVFGISTYTNEMPGAEICSSPEKAINGADYIILPLPVSRNGKTLNVSDAEKIETVELVHIVDLAHKNGNIPIIGGVIPESMFQKAKENGVETVDFYKRENLQLLNALPSAEGAILLAMQNTDKVLEGMNVLVTGYGRIGKLLARKLKYLGAVVTVAARRDEVLCEIAMSGYSAVRSTDSYELKQALCSAEIVLNTVPEIIFTKNVLSECTSRPLYLEIASVPGGIDSSIARSLGYNVIFAQSLPGKYAPLSAGEYIYETIRDILNERGTKI